jgi:hypothetical protein
LILFSRFCKEDEFLKKQVFHIRTIVRVAESEEKVESLPILGKPDYFIAHFKFWWSETSRMQLKIDFVNFKFNIVARPEGNIRVWCENCNFQYSESYRSIADFCHLQVVEAAVIPLRYL